MSESWRRCISCRTKLALDFWALPRDSDVTNLEMQAQLETWHERKHPGLDDETRQMLGDFALVATFHSGEPSGHTEEGGDA